MRPGIAFLPIYMLHHERGSGDLIPVLESQLYRRVGIYALYPQSRFLPPKTRAFIELLEQMFEQEEELFRH